MSAHNQQQRDHVSAVSGVPGVTEGKTLTGRLLEVLGARAMVRQPDLSRAARIADQTGEPLAGLLIKLGLVSERDLATILAEVYELPLLKRVDYPDTMPSCPGLSERFLHEHRVVPVAVASDSIVLAVADPSDRYVLEAVTLATGRQVSLQLGTGSEIEEAIDRLHGRETSRMVRAGSEFREADGQVTEEDVEHLKDLASEAPVIRLVNLIIEGAVQNGASDVHIEPFEGVLKVRCRVDGLLREVEAPPAGSTSAIVSRIKLMANLNIAERRLPQDGRIKLRIQGKELDLRVSTVPTLYGESVVIRILDRDGTGLRLDALGFSSAADQRVREMLSRPHGIVLVTGPTGSGKTTTLYSAMRILNNSERKIITVEDPVEYQIDGVNQIQVKPQIGLSFASALRSIVRQDPDVIMIGEMRDGETARIAVQAALTGHLVLSTLHTNDAASAVTRLLDMGVEDYLLASTLNGVLAQRLVRRVCPECRMPAHGENQALAECSLHKAMLSEGEGVYRSVGCEKCNGTGYRGRQAIIEVLPMTENIRHLVLQRAAASDIAKTARAEGMTGMYADGMAKVAAGITTFEEVLRVTREF